MLTFLPATALRPSLEITSDLARYQSGQAVHLRIVGSPSRDARLQLSLFHLGKRLTHFVSSWKGDRTFSWLPPRVGHGFLAVAELTSSKGAYLAKASCGLDVSPKWTDFPRYGYLAHFGPKLAKSAGSEVAQLNRFHINAIQFYDWQWRHHHPLPPTESWVDIANRPTSGNTVRGFIKEAHARNISCLAYNLGFGGVDGYDEDGISPDWMLYYDRSKKKPYALTMPAGWATHKLFIFDPGNRNWRAAIYPREQDAIREFGFDGWHMDQLGDLGKIYTAEGVPVSLKDGFPALLAGAKDQVRGDVIFNNVGGYGIKESIESPTDAMYLEAWHWMGQKSYVDLKDTVEHMRSRGKGAILAAYMDYEIAKKYAETKIPGTFNIPGVLLTDATIFASGGFHLELGDGDKMLCNEYFPNHNLEPSGALLDRLKPYYDFAVAYEDLLSSREVKPTTNPASVIGAASKRVWSFARSSGSTKIVHLINLAHPHDLEWRDPDGKRAKPESLKNVQIKISGIWRKAYLASPDDGVGKMVATPIRHGIVVVPKLSYWSMIVLTS